VPWVYENQKLYFLSIIKYGVPGIYDIKFVKALQEELILTVPGTGFGGPGHFRIAFCVDDETIRKAMPGFKRVIEKNK
jgi:aspartate/methionine/tyrosine aminotransferase